MHFRPSAVQVTGVWFATAIMCCGALFAATPEPVDMRYIPITFLVSGNTQGRHFRTAPAAPSTPLRAALFAWHRRMSPNVLAVDCGNLSSGFSPATRQDKGRLDFAILDRLDYACATIGPLDMEPGYPELQEKLSACGVPLVCANVFDKVTRRPVVPRMHLLEVPDGPRIGFTGLVGKTAARRLPEDIRRRIHISDAISAYDEIRKELRRNKADMTVILADMTVVEFFHLHERLGDYIDLVIGLREDAPEVPRSHVVKKTPRPCPLYEEEATEPVLPEEISRSYPLAWREGKTVVTHAPRGAGELFKLALVFRPGGVLSFELEVLNGDSMLEEDPAVRQYLSSREEKAARWIAEILFPEVLTRRLTALHRITSPRKSAYFAAEALKHHANSWAALTTPDMFQPGLPTPEIPLRRGDIYSLFKQPDRYAVLSVSVAWEARSRFLDSIAAYTTYPRQPEFSHPYQENRSWERVTIALPESMLDGFESRLAGDPFIKDIDVAIRSFHDIREVVTFYAGEALDHQTPARRGVRTW